MRRLIIIERTRNEARDPFGPLHSRIDGASAN
jgi:hypothetical protein